MKRDTQEHQLVTVPSEVTTERPAGWLRRFAVPRVRAAASRRKPRAAGIVRPRTILQDIAYQNRRSHAIRLCGRVVGLLVLDVCSSIATVTLLSWAQQALTVSGALHLDAWRSVSLMQTVAAICAGLFLGGAYNGGDARRSPQHIASGVGLGLLIALWPALWADFISLAVGGVIGGSVLFAVVLVIRLIADHLVCRTRPETLTPGRALLIGSDADVSRFLATLPTEDFTAFRKVAQLDPTRARRTPTDVADFYGRDELPEAISTSRADTIVLCGLLEDDQLTHLMTYADAGGCRVLAPSRAVTFSQLTPSVHWRDGVPMIELTRPGLHGRDLVLKRLLDLVGGGMLLVGASVVMIPVAALVWLTSPGPAIFRQRRVGYAGKMFTIYKFRTMYGDAEDRAASLASDSIYADGKLFKMTSDPRITPVGRWLRRLSLDELPQLLNVLSGDMSLVGPRPPLPREVDLYEDDEFIRFGMKPGITGPWQVSGRNRVTSFPEVLRIESAYLAQWTIWRDFEILARTVPAVLRMDGAQ